MWSLGDAPIAGRAAIVAEWTARLSKFAWAVQSAPQTVFEVDEHRGVGTGRVTVQERFKRRTGRVGGLLGMYHDTYVRQGRDWLFAERRLELLVADDGVGLPEALDPRSTRSLGLDLVFIFAGQLEAEVEIGRTPGARFLIRFAARDEAQA